MLLGEPDSQRVYQVALFGVTGCGKSSIINLLADKPVAKVSTSVEACTRRAQWFPILIEDKTFRLWDTMGFNQAEVEGINPLSPYEQAHALLRDLQNGIDLILLCAQKDRINTPLRNLYWLLCSLFFRGRAPIALVFTHFDVPDPGWWDRNAHVIAQRLDLSTEFVPHACITTIHDESSQSDSTYEHSKHVLRALLRERAVSSIKLPDLSLDATTEDVAESLRYHCQLNHLDAITLAERFRSPRRPLRAILFGESGSGKSSVINLMSGSSVANISAGPDNCTPSFCRYEINTGSHQFLVWDTVGFNGVYKGKDATEMALKNATRLVRDLHSKGGVDLLVFCKQYGRLSPSELNCFRLFHEFLCEGQVPVAFVITHLETYSPMEKWWEDYGEYLVKNCKLEMSAVAGHACITAAQHDPHHLGFHDKRLLSRRLLQTMFEDSISYGNAFNKDVEVWVMPFLKRLVGMIDGGPTRKEKVSITTLMDRCGLTRGQAEELLRLLNSPETSISHS